MMLPSPAILRRRLTTLIALLTLACASSLNACNVPVFRYALDHWAADNYQLQTPPPQTLSPNVSAKVHALADQEIINLAPHTVPSTQRAELLFPDTPGGLVWSGALDKRSLNPLLHSPTRTQIAQRICQGDSGVWVLLEGSDAAANDRAYALIEQASRQAEKTNALPVADPNDPSSTIGPGPDLSLHFSAIRLPRTAPGEGATIIMLEGSRKAAEQHRNQPVACLVFGRGHVLAALSGDELTESSLEDACSFLVGSCSCEVKSMHPGWDLLLDFDWATELEQVQEHRDQRAATEPATQALTLSRAGANHATAPETVTVHGADALAASTAIPGNIHRQWPLLICLGACLFAFAAIVVSKRKRTRHPTH